MVLRDHSEYAAMTEHLQRETAAFKRLLPSLMSDEGKFALIVGDELIGTFDSYNDALTAGYAKAKLEPFLVKRIAAVENIAYFSRNVEHSCRT